MSPQHGFSLIEVVCVIAIVAIGSSIATPSFTSAIAKSRHQTHEKELLHAVSLIRTAAVSQHTFTTLCASQDQEQCDENKTWENHYIAFVDPNKNGKRDVDEKMLYNFTLPENAGKISWASARQLPYLQFNPMGYTNMSNGTFTYCQPKDKLASKIILNLAGRAYVKKAEFNKACE